MTTTQPDAYSILCAHIEGVVQSSATALLGRNIGIEWPNITPNKTPSSTDYFTRVTIQTVLRPQTTFSSCVGRPGARRFTNEGVVVVLFLGPRTDQTSGRVLYQFGQRLKEAHSTKALPGIWLRNIVGNELPPDGGFNRLRVVAEFKYDEIM